METVSILVLDEDEARQAALRHMLDSDGWKLQMVPRASQALAELASGDWSLVIVNLSMTGLHGPLFETLKELALAPPVEAGRSRARVLFVVPEEAGVAAQMALEREQLPYVLQPIHLHDFLEKVSDLLLETQSILAPIRRVHHEARSAGERRKDRRTGQERRDVSMFAGREEYMMTEEEIAEFEKQEEEKRKKKKPKEKVLED